MKTSVFSTLGSTLSNLEKSKLDINFLNECVKTETFFQNSLDGVTLKHKPLLIKNNLCRKSFDHAIKERNNDIRNLSAEHDTNKIRSIINKVTSA